MTIIEIYFLAIRIVYVLRAFKMILMQKIDLESIRSKIDNKTIFWYNSIKIENNELKFFEKNVIFITRLDK